MFNDTANDGCDNTRYHAAIMFSLILLHWIILSIVPIHSTADKTNFFQPYQYALLLINVCYTYVCRYCSESNSKKSELTITLFTRLEAAAKIIVYGFFWSQFPKHLLWLAKLKERCPEWMMCWPAIKGCQRMTWQPLRSHDSRSPEFASARSFYAANSIRSMSFVPPNSQLPTAESNGDYEYQPAPWSPVASPSAPATPSTASTVPAALSDSAMQAYREDIPEDAITEFRLSSASSKATNKTDLSSELYGCLKVTHMAYCSSFSNVIDLLVITSYWIDLTLMLSSHDTFSLFKTLAAARILRLVMITEGTSVRQKKEGIIHRRKKDIDLFVSFFQKKTIMQSLATSLDMLRNVMGFFVFFWVLFSIFALFVLRNSFSRRCAVMPEGGLFRGISGKDR